ncbi:MAG: DUF2007 domain-containing protein [Ignavibacteriales bacterium]|nr:DUF2007 domain-containing protein [Ignavibacteriales bacterium]MBI3788933.1 DUF2007 domain-containing protein [Ignavibacteriales bacterium]
MKNSQQETFTCGKCGADIEKTFDFCPACGGVFVEHVVCVHHPHEEAEGVCVICSQPLCKICGIWVNGIFLCEAHQEYEVYEGMAKVFGLSDEVQASYAANLLKQAGLHPFLYQRKASPISLGGPDYTLFKASGEYNGHIINEIKIMVPCQEVNQAEKILTDLEILK